MEDFRARLDAAFLKMVASYTISPSHLRAYRILFCSAVIFVIGVPNFTWIAANPSWVFYPPTLSVGIFSKGFWGHWPLLLLSIALYGCYVSLLLGRFAVWAALGITLLQLIGFSFAFSFGKIDHNILFVLLPGLLAFSGWGKGALKKEDASSTEVDRRAFFVFYVALFLGFAMFTAGLQKLVSGWLSLEASATRGHFMLNYITYNRHALLAPLFYRLEQRWIWLLMDYATLLFEVGFLFALLRASLFRWFVAAAVVFHAFTLLIFNIGFAVHFPIYLLFLPWSGLRIKISPKAKAWLDRYGLNMLAALALLQGLWSLTLPPNMPLAAEPNFLGFALNSWFDDLVLARSSIVILIGLGALGWLCGQLIGRSGSAAAPAP